MSNSTRIKATLVLGALGLIAGVILGIDSLRWGNSFINVLLIALLGLLAGVGLVSVPLLSGWIWRKTAGIRKFGPVGFVICLVIWYFAFAFGLFITPIISIYKLIKAKKGDQYEREYELKKAQVQIENKDDANWREHF